MNWVFENLHLDSCYYKYQPIINNDVKALRGIEVERRETVGAVHSLRLHDNKEAFIPSRTIYQLDRSTERSWQFQRTAASTCSPCISKRVIGHQTAPKTDSSRG